MKMSEETITLDKHSASWLSSGNGKSNLSNSDDLDSKESNKKDNQTKPKWFEEMIKNTEELSKNVQSTMQVKNESDDIFDLKPIADNKENESNDIFSKRRNTLNILHTENQNFLNTLSNSNTSKSAKPFLESSIDTLVKNDSKNISIKNDPNDLPNELNELKNLSKSSKLGHKFNEIDKYEQDSFEEFIIPEEPEGKQLTIVLKSNYGDDDFIGLNGIEIMDVKSFRNLTNSNIKFLNHLDTQPEKLFDQTYRTHDVDHIWKCKFDKSKSVELKLEFESVKRIGIIRIWNYNRSRIYSYIGVKEMCIYLDDTKIFSGEIAKANGELKGDLNNFGDTILYTVDENKLEQLYKNDTSFRDATGFST